MLLFFSFLFFFFSLSLPVPLFRRVQREIFAESSARFDRVSPIRHCPAERSTIVRYSGRGDNDPMGNETTTVATFDFTLRTYQRPVETDTGFNVSRSFVVHLTTKRFNFSLFSLIRIHAIYFTLELTISCV